MQANTMDEPGGPEAALPDQDRDAAITDGEVAEEIARAEDERHDDVDPDFKPPLAR